MALNKQINARQQQKHDIEANWILAGNNGFVPLNGEIIVYDKDDNYDFQRVKIGDGVTDVNALKFVNQADWNASEGKPGHVLNRTHWVEDTRVTVLSSAVDYSNNNSGLIPTPFELIIGEEYTVEFGNIKFTATAINGKEISGTFSGCGALVNSEKDFLVIDTSKNSGYDNLGIYGVVDTPEGERASFIKICQGDLKIHKLDTKFLPDGVPYAVGTDLKEILSEATLTTTEDDSGMFLITTPITLTVGERYTIKLNGTEYQGTAVEYTEDGITNVMLTNDGTDMTTGAGAVFVLAILPSETATEDGVYAYLIVMSGETSVTMALYHGAREVRKLDNRCLDLEWLPVIDKAYLIPEQTVSAVDTAPDGSYMAVVKTNPEWDGSFSVSERTPLTISFQGMDFPAVGGGTMDGDFITPEAGGFYFTGFNDSWAIIVPSPGTYTISVSDPAQSAYNKIPEEFLPDSTATKEYVDEAIATITMTETTSVVIKSSTPGSTKKFKITVDDTGTLTVTEI